ncbi:dihydroxyacetone kinase subunit DhaK, partial [Nostoc sp. HG1]|nr:dihydroxyacetone kinase subunit DhaK [Nostoc sp. HG1]
EAGVEQVPFAGAADAIARMSSRLAPHMGSGRHVALINNLGSTTLLEMAVLTDELARSVIGQRIAVVVGPATMMTSLDMRGFSLSVLELDEGIEAALDAPAAPSVWPGPHQ